MKSITLRKISQRMVFLAIVVSVFSAASVGAAEREADEAVIRKLITTYFSSWSQADFSVYRSLFRQNASISFYERDRWQPWDLTRFLNEQESLQLQNKMEETPLSIDIKALATRAAFVEVSWRLLRRPDAPGVTGKDWFTLVKEGDDWKILNLTFWFDAPAQSPAK